MIKNKRGGVAEKNVFVGVIIILGIIFISLFTIIKLKNTNSENKLEEMKEDLDKEYLLINYLRKPFPATRFMNFADYIINSNFHVQNTAYYEEPLMFKEFKSKTKEYFDMSIKDEQYTWFLLIHPVKERNMVGGMETLPQTAYTSQDTENDVKIYSRPDETETGIDKDIHVIATQIIPSPYKVNYLIALYRFKR